MEIEEAAAGAAPDGAAGGSVPAQPFLSSAADGEPAPESSPAPRSPCPAEAAAAVLSVPSPAGVEGRWLGGGELNGGTGGTGGVGSGAGGSARRQVSRDREAVVLREDSIAARFDSTVGLRRIRHVGAPPSPFPAGHTAACSILVKVPTAAD